MAAPPSVEEQHHLRILDQVAHGGVRPEIDEPSGHHVAIVAPGDRTVLVGSLLKPIVVRRGAAGRSLERAHQVNAKLHHQV